MGAPEIELNQEEGRLTLSGLLAEGSEEHEWDFHQLDEHRVLVFDAEHRLIDGGVKNFGSCTTESFADVLLGFARRSWTGMVAVDLGFGVVRIYFSEGKLCFAGSNLMDHRLGEVIFRGGKISIEELTECAVLVTRSRKFGQVLLNKGVFSLVDLWHALRQQVIEIMRSPFFQETVYFETQEGVRAPTEVVFEFGTEDLINEAFAFGSMFREFMSRFNEDIHIKIVDDSAEQEFPEGTFVGDLLILVKENPKLESVLSSSKLTEQNTCVALMGLVNRRVLRIEGLAPALAPAPRGVSLLKSNIDAYSILLRTSEQAFSDAGLLLPVDDLKMFVSSLNKAGFEALFLNDSGELDQESRSNLYSQCDAHPDRIEYFAMRVEALIQFLLQTNGDMLSYDVARQIRENFRQVRA